MCRDHIPGPRSLSGPMDPLIGWHWKTTCPTPSSLASVPAHPQTVLSVSLQTLISTRVPAEALFHSLLWSRSVGTAGGALSPVLVKGNHNK